MRRHARARVRRGSPRDGRLLTRGERGIDGATLEAPRPARGRRRRSSVPHPGRRARVRRANRRRDRVFRAPAWRISTRLAACAPDVLLTHWPVDTHADHQVASLLSFRAWLALAQRFTLCCFEVNAGEQTRGFAPTDYVDITPVARSEAPRRARARQPGRRRHHARTTTSRWRTFRGRENRGERGRSVSCVWPAARPSFRSGEEGARDGSWRRALGSGRWALDGARPPAACPVRGGQPPALRARR